MGNSFGKFATITAITTALTVGTMGDNKNKPVDGTVDGIRTAMSNLLSNEAFAATQINPVEVREAKEVSTTLDLIKNIAEFNISDTTFNKIQDIIKEGESNNGFISRIITDDKTGATIEIYKTDEGMMGVEVQEVTINNKGESKAKGEAVKLEVGKGPLTISKGLVTMKTNTEGFITEITVGEASKGGEFTTIGCATPISKGMAMAIITELGDNIGFATSIGLKAGKDGKIMALVNIISADGTYSVPVFEGGKSDNVDKTIDQVGVKLKYEQQIKSKLIDNLKSYDVSLGMSKSSDEIIEEKTVDYNSDFYKLLKRGVEGATKVGASVGTTFELTKDITVRVELSGDYITWNVTGDNETSVGVGGQIDIKDIAKEMDRFSIDGKYSDLDRSIGVKYTYPINDSVDLTAGVEQRFETKYDENDETRVTAGMTYHFPVYDVDGKKVVSNGYKNVIVNGDPSLTESVFNFAKASLKDKVIARGFKHEELVKKPKVETPVTPTTPEVQETGLEDFHPHDKTLLVGQTYNTGLRNKKIKFTIEGTSGVVTISNGKITGVKEGNVTVYVTDGKITRHFKVTVNEKPVDGPEVKDDSFTTNKNTPIHGADIKANDGEGVVITGKTRNAENCTVEIVDGKANITPKTDFVGNATFEYEAEKNGIKAWATVTVKVEGGGDPELPLPTSSFASSSVTKTVGDGPFTNAFTTNSTGVITYSSNNTAVATVNATTGQVTIVGNGTAIIKASQAATSTYKADTDTFTLTVGNTPELPLPTSSFASSSVTKTVGDGPFTNAFTTNSSGAITYSSNNTSVATVNSTTGQVTIVGEGNATITANQAATSTYKADTDTFNLTVGNTPELPLPTSSFASSSVTKTVGDSSFTNTFTTNSSGAITYSSNNTAVATVNSTTGQVTIVGEGNATITASQAATSTYKADTDNFSLTVNNVANQAPVAGNGSVDAGGNYTVNYDFGPIVSDDSTPDNQLSFSVTSNPQNLNVTGSFPNMTFTTTSYAGSTNIGYQVCDTQGECDSGTVDVTDIAP